MAFLQCSEEETRENIVARYKFNHRHRKYIENKSELLWSVNTANKKLRIEIPMLMVVRVLLLLTNAV